RPCGSARAACRSGRPRRDGAPPAPADAAQRRRARAPPGRQGAPVPAQTAARRVSPGVRRRWRQLADELAAEFAREGGRLLLGREIDLNDNGAVDMLIAKDCRLETAAVEPLAHPRHPEDEIAGASAALGAVEY